MSEAINTQVNPAIGAGQALPPSGAAAPQPQAPAGDPTPTALAANDAVTLEANAARPAAQVSLVDEPARNPGPAPQDAGLRSRPWFQGTAPVSRGEAMTPLSPMWTVAADSTWQSNNPDSTKNVQNTDITYAELDALGGQSFDTVAAEINTPERVTEFLANQITYDGDRAANATGTLAAESSTSVLAQGNGVCRDQHALARDLLVANGYNAETLAYGAPGQFHAITVYQDPETGYWGMIEYGTIYQAHEIKARTAEEALLLVRPATTQIWRLRNDGPDAESVAEHTTYTRTFRTFERFIAGPATNAAAGARITTAGVSYAQALGDGNTHVSGQVVTRDNPALEGAMMVGAWRDVSDSVRVGGGLVYAPNNTEYLVGSNNQREAPMAYGFVSLEENHPRVVGADNLAGAGVNVRVSSHTQMQAVAGIELGEDHGLKDSAAALAGAAAGLSKGTTNPELHVSKSFSVWRQGSQDTEVGLRYGVGFDLGLQATNLAQGGDDLLLNQYVAADLTTRLGKSTEIAMGYYQPITNVTNDFAASPTGYLALSTPNLRLSTTQSLEAARYEAEAGSGSRQVHLSGYAIVDHDRMTRQVATEGGIRLEIKDRKKNR